MKLYLSLFPQESVKHEGYIDKHTPLSPVLTSQVIQALFILEHSLCTLPIFSPALLLLLGFKTLCCLNFTNFFSNHQYHIKAFCNHTTALKNIYHSLCRMETCFNTTLWNLLYSLLLFLIKRYKHTPTRLHIKLKNNKLQLLPSQWPIKNP